MIVSKHDAIRGNSIKRTMRLNNLKSMRPDIPENLLPVYTPKLTYNCTVNNGALISKYGVGLATLKRDRYPRDTFAPSVVDTGKKKIWHYRRYDYLNNCWDDRYVADLYGGHLYAVNIENCEVAFSKTYGSLDMNIYAGLNYHYNGEDIFILGTSKGVKYLDNDNIYSVDNSPKLKSLCKHGERVFGVMAGNSTRVWFSGNANPTNWTISATDGGYIDIPSETGRPIKVLSFLDYLYIFCEHGIYRLYAYAEQSEFYLKRLYVAAGTINGDTITLCGDRIIFASEEGIFSFDGANITATLREYWELPGISFEDSIAEYSNGKYYLSARVEYEDLGLFPPEQTYTDPNSLIIYDVTNNEGYLMRGIFVSSMFSVVNDNMSKVLFTSLYVDQASELLEITEEGKLINKSMTKAMVGGFTDTGYPDKIKILKSVVVTSKYTCKLSVRLDNITKNYNLPANKQWTIPIRIRFRRMSITFSTTENSMEISNPTVIIDYA